MSAAIELHWQQQFKKHADAFVGLKTERQHALLELSRYGLPTSKLEAWKYSNPAKINAHDWTVCAKPENFEKLIAPFLAQNEFYNLIFVDGYLVANELDVVGVEVQNLAIVAETLSDQITTKAYLQGFSWLNYAMMTDGAVINIAANTQVDKPIRLLILNSKADLMCNLRHVVNLAAHSKVHIVEQYVGVGQGKCFVNSHTQLQLQESAHCVYDKIVNDTDLYHVGMTSISLYKHSHCRSLAAVVQGAWVRSDIDVQLLEAEARCQLFGLYAARLSHHIDQHTNIEHRHAHTYSEQIYKGIVRDKARAVFNGRVFVAPGVAQIKAAQKNNNLLLSNTAEVDTKPQLEIYADDVQCSHGATVGQLDEQALFYLQTRGLSRQEASDLLVFAFVNELLAMVSDEYLHAQIAAAV